MPVDRIGYLEDIMPNSQTRLLLVEDSPDLARVYIQYLGRNAGSVTHVETGAEAIATLESDLPSVVLLDLQLPGMSGMEVLRHVSEQKMPVAVIIITGHGTIDLAVEAMQLGAVDFLEKPFNANRLRTTVQNALERHRLSELVETYEDLGRPGYCGFIGSSLNMQAVYRMIESAAPSSASVFVTGESGTGKEVCAQAIHERSPRKKRPFIALNCASVPAELMESEVFGHVKGAFTGAVSSRDGAASRANGGTLFFDEIAEMSPDLQAKLLRFVQTGSVQKVGSDSLQQVDVRFICATNKNPLVEVSQGRFREDLYYRLHVIPIHLPPLRDRGNDVIAIARHFLQAAGEEEHKDFSGFSLAAESVITSFDWPGNVRQLQNAIRHVAVVGKSGVVTPELFPPPLNGIGDTPAPNRVPETASNAGPSNPTTESTDAIRPLWVVEKEVIEKAIDACDGNIPRAAALLELSPSTIYRKRQKSHTDLTRDVMRAKREW